jgi:DNA-binding MltR family transcriptional regulator
MTAKKSPTQRYFEEVRNKVPVHWLVWEEVMNKMEDAERMQVLNRDTMIDSTLKDLLLLFIFSRDDEEVEELFHPNRGALSSLTNKARLAYALNLIDKQTLKDLRNIHNIRNKFAHSTDMDFDNDEVLQLVGKLSTATDKDNNSFEPYSAAYKSCSKAVRRALVKEINKVSGRMKKKKKAKKKKSG